MYTQIVKHRNVLLDNHNISKHNVSTPIMFITSQFNEGLLSWKNILFLLSIFVFPKNFIIKQLFKIVKFFKIFHPYF